MSTEASWTIALVAGLVVSVVAWVLLHIFYQQVRRIERASQAVWEAGKQVARNTATTWQLGVLSADLDDLTHEVLRHDALLRAGAPAAEPHTPGGPR